MWSRNDWLLLYWRRFQSIKYLKTYTFYYKRGKVISNIKNKGIFATFFTTENRNLDSEIAKVGNLKTQKLSLTQLKLAQFLCNQCPKIIRAFSQRQNTNTRARKNFADWVGFSYHKIFGGHWPYKRGDIKFLICHVTSRDHVIRGPSEIMGEFPSS